MRAVIIGAGATGVANPGGAAGVAGARRWRAGAAAAPRRGSLTRDFRACGGGGGVQLGARRPGVARDERP